MTESLPPWLAALAILALNVPFGYWRAGLRKLSPLWFIAIHAPIPVAVGLRLALDIPFRLITLPLFVAAFFGGQWLGGRLRRDRTAGQRREGTRSRAGRQGHAG